MKECYYIKIYLVGECSKTLLNELEHDKTNKMTCVPSEDSDQPGHLPSLMCTLRITKDPRFLYADREDSDQIGQMPRLDPSLCWMRRSFVSRCDSNVS